MIRHIKSFTLTLLFAFLISSCASSDEALQSRNSVQQDKILNLITQLPAENEAERQYIFGELAGYGPDGVRTLTDLLTPSGVGNNTYVRYAVNGLAKHVSRPGAEAERSFYETALLEKLTSGTSRGTKTFLMNQLELTGSDQAVPVLESFLTDQAMYDPAAQALTEIGTPAAQQALQNNLGAVSGKPKVSIIKALGDLRSTQAAEDILPLASSENNAVKDAALYTLAQLGQPGAEDVLTEAVSVAEGHRQTQAQSMQLLYAQRLAEEGFTDQSNNLLDDLFNRYQDAHVKGAVLAHLVENGASGVQEKVLAAAESSDAQLRGAALSLAPKVNHPISSEIWIQKLGQSEPAVQADILDMLGRSQDASLVPEVESYLDHDHSEVRRAAIRAYTALAGADALPALIRQLEKPNNSGETEELKTALLQMPAGELPTVAAEALPEASDQAKITLIELLASRQAATYFSEVMSYTRHSSPEVRQAALQALEPLAGPDDVSTLVGLLPQTDDKRAHALIGQAIIAAVKEAGRSQDSIEPILEGINRNNGNARVTLLQVLPQIGGSEALTALAGLTESSETELNSAAIETLSSWPDATAIPHLLNGFENASESDSEIIARGLSRLIPSSLYSADQKVMWLNRIADSAPTPEGKTSALKALASLQSPQALRTISAYLGHHDPEISDAAVQSMATMLASSGNYSDNLSAADGILSVVETTVNPQLRNRIEEQIRRIRTGAREADEFTSLFNGQDLSGWTGATDAYAVEDGKIISKPNAGGNLFTEDEYSDFVLRFEFKLTEGANNGLGIRAPLEGDAAYEGFELQILDNTAEKYANLQPYQYHGSVYGIIPARRGYLNPVGEWNTQEVIARGSNITVRLNGTTILDADVSEAATPEPADGREHPGLQRNSGHIGFLGHGSQVEFRNIRIKDLTRYFPDYSMSSNSERGMNQPPEGFEALFNGEDLSGWKGLVGNPESRAQMSQEELAREQAKADSLMREHWSVRNGILYFDGEGSHLCTIKEYGDFEMLLDWKIEPGGDSGVYLRGAPQVQIWDVNEWPQGSGGLYNNQQNPADPLTMADNPIGEWNRMRIRMVGDKVTVHLNGELVVNNVPFENYWDRSKPIYPVGQIELQSHSTPLYFRNVFIREIPRAKDLLASQDLSGWQPVGDETASWHVENGVLYTEGEGDQWSRGAGGGWLSTDEQYDNFKLELEYRLPEGGNSGVFLRAPHEGDPAFEGLEIQLLDDSADQYQGLEPWQYTGSIYDVQAPSKKAAKGPGQWQKMTIVADGPALKVTLNGERVIDTNLAEYMDRVSEHPGLKRRKGYIGLQNHNTKTEFRNITITEIK